MAVDAAHRFLRLTILCIFCVIAHASVHAAIEPSPLDLKLSQSGVVNAILPMPDGSYVVGGSFSSINGMARSNIARINADGTAFGAFSANTNGPVYALAYDGDDIYVGGNFTSAGGHPMSNLCRISSGGWVDSAWVPNVGGIIYALGYRITSSYGNNGFLYAGGAFTTVAGSSTYARLARFQNSYRNVTLDTNWQNPANGTVRCITPTASGVYVGGDFTSIGSNWRSRGAELFDYSSIGSWNPGANGRISAIIQTPAGIIVGGSFTSIGNSNTAYLAGLDTNGNLLSSWPATSQAGAPVQSLALRDSYVYAGGASSLPQPCFRISANSPFATDSSYLTNINGAVSVLATSGTSLLVGGSFTKSKGVVQPSFSRFALTGATLVSTTATGARSNATVSAIIATPDGGVIVGGYFDLAGETLVKNLARFSATAVLNATWTPAPNAQVSCLALSGSDLYVGGYFSEVSGVSRSRLAKLSLTGAGAVDSTWNPGANAEPFALHIAQNKLHIGGNFTQLGGTARNQLGRVALTGEGAIDADLMTGLNGSVRTITSVGDYLYVGGSFTAFGNTNHAGLARFNLVSGAPDTQWRITSLTSGNVTALHYKDPWLYVGGSYSFWGPSGLMVYSICRIETGATATLDPNWRPGTSIGADFNFLTSKGDYLYAGGGFQSIGAQLGQNPVQKTYLARVHISGRGAAEPLWPGANLRVYPGVISGNRLFVGGIFTQVGTAARISSAIIDLDSPLTTSTITPYATPTQPAALTIAPSGFTTGITHFRVKSSTNGNLFLANGVTPVTEGQFITVANAAAGLVFVPNNQLLPGWFEVEESKSASLGGIVGTPATVFINVDRAAQTITFNPLGEVFYGDAPRTLVAVASSGEPVAFSGWGAARVSGNVVTFAGTGSAGLQASQAGTANYLPASVQQLFTIKGMTYSEWRSRTFGADAENTAIAGDAIDGDKDGVANLLEFAFGSDPTLADKAANAPTLEVKNVNGINRLVLTFKRRRSAPDSEVNYVAEFNQTLGGTWTAQPPSTVTWVDDNWETVTVIDPEPLPVAGNSARFGRVRVSPILPWK